MGSLLIMTIRQIRHTYLTKQYSYLHLPSIQQFWYTPTLLFRTNTTLSKQIYIKIIHSILLYIYYNTNTCLLCQLTDIL